MVETAAHLIDHVFPRPPVHTPLPGLFLAGAGTRDRPGIADVFASGAKAAMEAIKALAEAERAGQASISRALSDL